MSEEGLVVGYEDGFNKAKELILEWIEEKQKNHNSFKEGYSDESLDEIKSFIQDMDLFKKKQIIKNIMVEGRFGEVSLKYLVKEHLECDLEKEDAAKILWIALMELIILKDEKEQLLKVLNK